MLKKVTILSAALMMITLFAGLLLVPAVIRDVLRDGDKILSSIISSTPVSNYSGVDYPILNIDIPGAEIIIEQSTDDQIYLRVEGFMADRYRVAASETIEDGEKVLGIRMDNDDSFFDGSATSYLVRRSLWESTYTAVVLRVPENVSVTTSGSPWRINYQDNVKFANRDYYDERQWNEEEENRQVTIRAVEQLLEKYDTMRIAYQSDLDAAAARLQELDRDGLDAFGDEIDRISAAHLGRMKKALFPVETPSYDMETLGTILSNAFDIQSSAIKMQARVSVSENEENGNESSQIWHQSQELTQKAANTWAQFENLYREYLESVKETLPSESVGLFRIGPDGKIITLPQDSAPAAQEETQPTQDRADSTDPGQPEDRLPASQAASGDTAGDGASPAGGETSASAGSDNIQAQGGIQG